MGKKQHLSPGSELMIAAREKVSAVIMDCTLQAHYDEYHAIMFLSRLFLFVILKLVSCTVESKVEVHDKCKEELDEYSSCLGHKLRKKYVKCSALSTSLQKCAVKNQIGEMKK